MFKGLLAKNEALLGTIGIGYPILWPIHHHHIDPNKSLSVRHLQRDTVSLDTATLTIGETAKLLGILRGLDHYLAGKEVMPNLSDLSTGVDELAGVPPPRPEP